MQNQSRIQKRIEKHLTGGNCKHVIEKVQSLTESTFINGEFKDEVFDLGQTVISLYNDDDMHYYQTFKNKQEVKDFVSKITDLADEIWPD